MSCSEKGLLFVCAEESQPGDKLVALRVQRDGDLFGEYNSDERLHQSID
jgi:hypothetical protein